MRWVINGAQCGIHFDLDWSGAPSIRGKGAASIIGTFTNTTEQQLNLIVGAEHHWTLCDRRSRALATGLYGDAILERALNSTDDATISVSYFSDPTNGARIEIVACLQPEAIDRAWGLFVAIASSDRAKYSISMLAHGFRSPHAQTETPTFHEFLGGKTLMLSEIDLHASFLK